MGVEPLRPMARRVAPLLLALAVLTAACGGGTSSDDDTSVGDGVGTRRSTAAGDGSTAPGDGATTSGGKNGSATTGKAGSRAAGGTSAGATTKSGAAKVGAAPGVYQYSRKGTSSVSGGYTASKKVDASYTATVEESSGTEQRTVFTGSSPEEEQTVRYTDSGSELVHMVLEFGGGKRREFRPNPAVRLVPTTATPGTTWSYTLTSTDGSTTIAVVSKVVGTERITGGGKTVDTVVLEVKLDTKTPELTRTETRTIWWSPKYRLMVKGHEVSEGDQAGFHVRSEADTTIRSLDP